MLLEPTADLRKTFRTVGARIHFYGNLIGNLGSDLPDMADRRSRAEEEFRQLAGDIRSQAAAIPLYWVVAFCRGVPRRSHIDEATRLLTRLSNLIRGWKAEELDLANRDAEEIKRLLGLPYSKRSLRLWRDMTSRPSP